MIDDGVDLLGQWNVREDEARFMLWARIDDDEPSLLIVWMSEPGVHKVRVTTVRQWIRAGIVKPVDSRSAGE
jgi:hypothetical protein